ncbi:unnamed protein product [Coregonus sp. 'balchen']|nr:unnamed protein product [Coregonus sp. 'balchen']
MAAPLAHFDEDWQDFNEFKAASGSPNRLDHLNSNVADTGLVEDFSDLDNSFSGEICSFKSMEDLVHDFDEKLTVCFRNYNTKTENIAPIKPITEDNFLKDDEVWNALTDNYGNVMPVDWKTSHIRSLHLPTLNLREQGVRHTHTHTHTHTRSAPPRAIWPKNHMSIFFFLQYFFKRYTSRFLKCFL